MIQVHCHQHAVLGFDADLRLMQDMGVEAERLDSGCCGLAGNFGFEPGHLQLSRDCAERVLLPAVRGAEETTEVVADGFSCRTQLHELDSGGREAVHLAELLLAARRGEHADVARPERRDAVRPAEPSRAARAVALAGVAAGAAAVLVGVAGVLRRSGGDATQPLAHQPPPYSPAAANTRLRLGRNRC
jgi:hypothetical protein